MELPTRTTLGIDHVSSAPIKADKDVTMDVLVRVPDRATVAYWHRNIQMPYINRDPGRVDYGWNWNNIRLTHTVLGSALGQRPSCYSVGVTVGLTSYLPLGMAFLAEMYPALHDRMKHSVFLWYLAAAPDKFYEERFPDLPIPSLGRVLIDIGITCSFNNLHKGLIGLHAAPGGGAELKKMYAHCGLLPLPPHYRISLLRPNDGGYYYADDQVAMVLSRYMDKLR